MGGLRTFYMARKDQGGGVLLDECHAFDWMQWLCGPITGVFSVVGTFSDLEVETDDVCEVVARFGIERSARSISTWWTARAGPRSSSSAPRGRSSSTCESTPFASGTPRPASGRLPTFEPSYDQIYVDEIDTSSTGLMTAKPRVDLREGYQIQRVIDACDRSSASGRWVTVPAAFSGPGDDEA